jgi:hypothetical protein
MTGGAVTPEQIQGLAERKPSPAPVLPDPCLQREPLSLGIALQLLFTVMAQLLKCLEVQQGPSSFLFSPGVRVLCQEMERLCDSLMSRPFLSNCGIATPSCRAIEQAELRALFQGRDRAPSCVDARSYGGSRLRRKGERPATDGDARVND